MGNKFKAYFNDSCCVGWSEPFTFKEVFNNDMEVPMSKDNESASHEPINCALVIVRCEE